MSTYQIDGEELNPQPITHEWDEVNIIGHDGEGFPITAKYTGVTLTCDLEIAKHFWRQYVDGATHTVTLPARDTVDDFTDYTTVIIDSVEHGAVSRKTGMNAVTMRIIRIEE